MEWRKIQFVDTEKRLKKGVDKSGMVWYYIKAVENDSTTKGAWKEDVRGLTEDFLMILLLRTEVGGRKNLKKFSKNSWQKALDVVIWISRQTKQKLRESGKGPWKLNNARRQIPVILKKFKYFKNYKVRKHLKINAMRFSKWANKLMTKVLRRKPWDTIVLRVWSWLRTNAGGMPNTCKSNGD